MRAVKLTSACNAHSRRLAQRLQFRMGAVFLVVSARFGDWATRTRRTRVTRHCGVFVASLLFYLASLGCASIPKGRAAVNSIEVRGTKRVTESEIVDHLATAKTPKFFGLFRGVVYDYEIFDRFVLQRDLQRVERYYRARGFYQARVWAGRVFYVDDRHVRVVIYVDEGPRTYVRDVKLDGLLGLPQDVIAKARAAEHAGLAVGEPFDEDVFVDTEKKILRALTDSGYAAAEVKRHAQVDLPRSYADIGFAVVPNVRARFGSVRITGLGKIPEGPVRRALDINEGDQYSTAAMEDAEQALLDLGVFRSVEIEPQFTAEKAKQTVVPLVVRAEPGDLHAVHLGGGIELDVTRADAHLVAGWEHRNLFGGLRHFSVEFKPGVVFYPTRLPSLKMPTAYLPEEKFQVELEQPGFIEARTSGYIQGQFNIFPILLSADVDETAPVLGYQELKGTLGLRRRIWRFFLNPTYNLQMSTPFTYQGELDPALRGVVISYAGLKTTFDLRNDTVQPHRGIFVGNDLEFAGLGGDARDVKVQPELRGYVPLGKEPTLALRASTGFLFPMNYGRTLSSNARVGQPPPGVDRTQWVRDTQLLFFRAFFSGGPNSNRGYPLRGVGPHGVVPFFAPELTAQELQLQCDQDNPDFDARCNMPLGGMTLWEGSAEFRYPVKDPFAVVTFCDASDVSQARVNLRFTRPHLSCGLGARYGTPVGPVRFDIGYRIPGMQVLVKDEPPSEGTPGTILGLPVAINIGVGEAF